MLCWHELNWDISPDFYICGEDWCKGELQRSYRSLGTRSQVPLRIWTKYHSSTKSTLIWGETQHPGWLSSLAGVHRYKSEKSRLSLFLFLGWTLTVMQTNFQFRKKMFKLISQKDSRFLWKMQRILFLIKKSNDHKYYLHFYSKKWQKNTLKSVTESYYTYIHACTAILASQKHLIVRYRVDGQRKTRLWDVIRVKI